MYKYKRRGCSVEEQHLDEINLVFGASDGVFTTGPLDLAQSEPLFTSKLFSPYWPIISDMQRRISLPVTGELVLGRFDPDIKEPLDVDLTFEDQNRPTVSRRHAKIVGTEGRYTIEDLGSSNGSFINGTRIEPGHAHHLKAGDRIMLGGVIIEYETVPGELCGVIAVKGADLRDFLYLAHVGRETEISSFENITLGRTDP
jgi:hypothetical protein